MVDVSALPPEAQMFYTMIQGLPTEALEALVVIVQSEIDSRDD